MSVDGVWQLQKIVLQYCKHGGSSQASRILVKSPAFVAYASKNPQIQFKVVEKNGRHPNLKGLYVNGVEHVHDLRKLEMKGIFDKMDMMRNQKGRTTGSFKRWGTPKSQNTSIQGRWHPEQPLPDLKDFTFSQPQ